MKFSFPKIIILVIFALAVVAGGVYYWPSSTPSIPADLVVAKQLVKSADIVLAKADASPQIPKYNLPLKTSDIANYQKLSERIKLSSEALSLLEKNGFAVVSSPKNWAGNRTISPLFTLN